jgi:hypothetical protein
MALNKAVHGCSHRRLMMYTHPQIYRLSNAREIQGILPAETEVHALLKSINMATSLPLDEP